MADVVRTFGQSTTSIRLANSPPKNAVASPAVGRTAKSVSTMSFVLSKASQKTLDRLALRNLAAPAYDLRN